jgi:hypothetical protein
MQQQDDMQTVELESRLGLIAHGQADIEIRLARLLNRDAVKGSAGFHRWPHTE